MPKDDPLAVFGRKVRRLRGARRMSLPELASSSGLAPLTITSIEGGEGVLSVSVIRALAKGLKVSPEELLRGLPMLSITAETRHLFAAPSFVSSMEGMQRLRSRAGGEARAPSAGASAKSATLAGALAGASATSATSAGARASRRPKGGEVALLAALSDAALKRSPA
jgi:transcriptional regulator with XRE-family HTH domain